VSDWWSCGFVGEGTSDDALVDVLGRLTMSLRPGDDIDVSKHHWIERPSDRSVKGKVEALRTEPYDLIFIHRDSDAMGWEPRAKEILGCCDERVVPVIAVRMTEAWAIAHLWSNGEFRGWAKSKGVSLKTIESQADPKRLLREYCSRNLRELIPEAEFGYERARIIKSIDIDGCVSELKAWKKLCEQIKEAMVRVKPYIAWVN
jgi:hypothetical protein